MIWFSGVLVSVRLEVGLDSLGGLFQHRRFCDFLCEVFAKKTVYGKVSEHDWVQSQLGRDPEKPATVHSSGELEDGPVA